MKHEVSVFTTDNVRIALSHYLQGNDTLVIVSHGFFNSRSSRSLERVAQLVLPRHDVITFDYRGHGQSAGTYTFGARECRDLEAVLAYARCFPYRRRALIGFSLGAAVPVASPALGGAVDSLMLVSCPSDFYSIDCHFWEKAALVSFRDLFGANGKHRRPRIGNPFLSKPRPVSLIKSLRQPILFVHGQRDWLIKPWHSRLLFSRSERGRRSRLEILYDGYHGEKLTEQFPERFRQMAWEWFRETLA